MKCYFFKDRKEDNWDRVLTYYRLLLWYLMNGANALFSGDLSSRVRLLDSGTERLYLSKLYGNSSLPRYMPFHFQI